MAIADTKVMDKKGKAIIVLTAGVRDLVNGLKKFQEDLGKDSDNI
jgi:hypothetical protein